MRRDCSFLLFGKTVEQHSCAGLVYLFSLYFGSILFAVLVTPVLYPVISGIVNYLPADWAHGSYLPKKVYQSFVYLQGKSFIDYFSRIRWIPVLLFFPWLLVKCNLHSMSRLGIGLDQLQKKHFRLGLIWGACLVGIIILGQCLTIPVVVRKTHTFIFIFETAIISLLAGMILGGLEETIFRGLIFRIFYTAFSPVTAIICTSLFFSYTHFKFPESAWSSTWQSSYWVSAQIGFFTVFGFLKEFNFVSFLNLFLLGILLSLFTMKEKSLMKSIGFHAAIVFGMLLFKRLYILQDNGEAIFLGSGKMVDGFACTLLLLMVIFWNARFGQLFCSDHVPSDDCDRNRS